MPRPCSVCTHPELYTINGYLIDGKPLRLLAEHYHLKRSSLSRHQRQHPLNTGYIPPQEVTRQDFRRFLWSFSVKVGKKQVLYCPLCQPETPSATLYRGDLYCNGCGMHTLEMLATEMGFILTPYYGFSEWRETLLERHEAFMSGRSKKMNFPRRPKRDKRCTP